MQTLIPSLNREEILRYLGYQGQPLSESMQQTIDRCAATTLRVIVPKYLYRRFPILRTSEGLRVGNTPLLLRGEDIRTHLDNCEELYLLCATVGLPLEREIRTAMLLAPDEGVILDSCGTTAVEALADLAEEEIGRICAREGKNLTWRFSPGYGDLPLDAQRQLIEVMDAHRKIGLSLTDSLLMTPSKSVTAILGVTDTKKDSRKNKCEFCRHRGQCSFRKRGTQC